MYQHLHQAIQNHFARHRIILWYDDNGSGRDVFEAFDDPDVQKLEIQNNEFAIKHRVLKRESARRFLLYAPYPRPEDGHNWLLDLVLSQFVFASDKAALATSELGLSDSFRSVVESHLAFFENHRDRLEPLKALVDPGTETAESLRLKMIGVLVGRSAAERREPRRFEELLPAIAIDSCSDKPAIWPEVEKYRLQEEFFRRASEFGYSGDQPSVQGFILFLFDRVFELESTATRSAPARKASVLLSGWQNSLNLQGPYQQLALWAQNELDLESRVSALSMDARVRVFVVPVVDRVVARDIAEQLTAGSYDTEVVRRCIAQRREGYWASHGDETLRDVYAVLEQVLETESAVQRLSWRYATESELWQDYVSRLCRIDTGYREALHRYHQCDAPGFLSTLIEKLNDRYVFQFLQPLCERWDQLTFPTFDGKLAGVLRQRAFFDRVVEPYLKNDRLLVVIISDGLRYEIGHEVAETLRSVNRFDTEIEPMLASLPSFTQMGMNSLLPHRSIAITLDGKVVVDGKALAGMEQRAAHLEREFAVRFPGRRAKAMSADALYQLPKAAAREEVEGVDLLYLYRNQIDAVGDNAKTERSVAAAAAQEIGFLCELCRKIAGGLNRTHIVITADHGFLYQDAKVEDIHLLPAPPASGKISMERRYILSDAPIHAEHVADRGGSTDAVHVAFPEGLYRLRKQGGGTRYVHGGTSLQEVCVPVIRVHKTRQDDLGQVDVQILMSSNRVITTGTFAVTFFQDRPVDAKTRGRRVRMYFAAEDGTVVSDRYELTFDSPDAAEQNRGRVCRFNFTPDAKRYNGRSVYLVLEDVRSSGHAVPYARESYRYQTMGELDF